MLLSGGELDKYEKDATSFGVASFLFGLGGRVPCCGRWGGSRGVRLAAAFDGDREPAMTGAGCSCHAPSRLRSLMLPALGEGATGAVERPSPPALLPKERGDRA